MQQNVPNQAIHVVEAPNEKIKDGCYTKAATVLGVLHIIFGVICLGAESAFLDSDYSKAIDMRIGTGIWTAVFFFISGALSIGGAQSGNKGLVVATLVMSIISAVLAGTLLILSSISFAAVTDRYRRSSNYDYGGLIYAEYSQAASGSGLLIAMGVIMLGISIASASLTCKLLCCRSNNQGAVHYNPNQGAYNPNQGPYNPNQVPSNVLLNPNYNPSYNPNHIASVHPPNVQAPSTSAQVIWREKNEKLPTCKKESEIHILQLLQTSDNPPAYQEVAGTGNNCQKF